MRLIKKFVPLLILAWMAVCCKPEESGSNEKLWTLQRANVRMEIKKQGSQAKTDVGIVGDSASVKRLARWGHRIFAILTDNFVDPSMAGQVYPVELSADNYSFSRDTVSCIYIFAFTSVFDYRAYETFLDGRPAVGVPGTERPGWLMFCEDVVFVGYYDTIKQCYKDPMIESYLDTATGYWVYPEPFWDNARIDTMGYIPQSIMEANYPRLQRLYDEGRYSEMVDVMQTGYTIYTCTGEEYRELVRLGIN